MYSISSNMSEVQFQPNQNVSTEEKNCKEATLGPSCASVIEPLGLSVTSSGEVSSERPRQITGFPWFLLVLSVISSVLLFSLDTTIVADIQPALVHDLGQIEKLPWISVALAVSATGTCPLW